MAYCMTYVGFKCKKERRTRTEDIFFCGLRKLHLHPIVHSPWPLLTDTCTKRDESWYFKLVASPRRLCPVVPPSPRRMPAHRPLPSPPLPSAAAAAVSRGRASQLVSVRRHHRDDGLFSSAAVSHRRRLAGHSGGEGGGGSGRGRGGVLLACS